MHVLRLVCSGWGKDDIKEELLLLKKCFYIIIHNELPVRHNAEFELMVTPFTSKYKYSCIVKTLGCPTLLRKRSKECVTAKYFSFPPPQLSLFCYFRARWFEVFCTIFVGILLSKNGKEKLYLGGENLANGKFKEKVLSLAVKDPQHDM